MVTASPAAYLQALVVILAAEINVVQHRPLYPRALLTPFTDDVDLTESDVRAYTGYARSEGYKGFQRVEASFGRSGEPGSARPEGFPGDVDQDERQKDEREKTDSRAGRRPRMGWRRGPTPGPTGCGSGGWTSRWSSTAGCSPAVSGGAGRSHDAGGRGSPAVPGSSPPAAQRPVGSPWGHLHRLTVEE